MTMTTFRGTRGLEPAEAAAKWTILRAPSQLVRPRARSRGKQANLRQRDARRGEPEADASREP
jgi:hypothetical protein